MNEAETRAEHIDPALKAAGWGVVEGSRILREYHISPGRIEGRGRRGTPEIADYVLVYRNIKLAVNEAKARDKAVTEGVAQAKSYAAKMKIRFTFSTNGQGIYRIDMETGEEGEISQYPTPDELWNLTFAKQNAWRDHFAAIPFEDRGGYFQGRYYQDIFDVLSYVAYTSPPVTREIRAGIARQSIHGLFTDKQQAFLDFVLSHYVSVGVEELDMAKLSPLLKLRYHDSIPDALADLGSPESISEVFSGFQKFLYGRVA